MLTYLGLLFLALIAPVLSVEVIETYHKRTNLRSKKILYNEIPVGNNNLFEQFLFNNRLFCLSVNKTVISSVTSSKCETPFTLNFEESKEKIFVDGEWFQRIIVDSVKYLEKNYNDYSHALITIGGNVGTLNLKQKSCTTHNQTYSKELCLETQNCVVLEYGTNDFYTITSNHTELGFQKPYTQFENIERLSTSYGLYSVNLFENIDHPYITDIYDDKNCENIVTIKWNTIQHNTAFRRTEINVFINALMKAYILLINDTEEVTIKTSTSYAILKKYCYPAGKPRLPRTPSR